MKGCSLFVSFLFVLTFVGCYVDENSDSKIEGTVCSEDNEENALEGNVYLCKDGVWKLIRRTIFAVPNIGIDGANDLKIDDDGNIYIAGYTYNELEGYNNIGEGDAILIKMDNEFNILWQYQWGTEKEDSNRSIFIDKEKNVYVAGSTKDNWMDQENSGHSDIFITKINILGEEVWTKLIGTENIDVPKSIKIDKKGNIFLLWDDLFDDIVSKLNEDFEEVWKYRFDADECFYKGVNLEIDKNDNFFVSHYNEKYDASCQERIYIIKRDNDGEEIWSRSKKHYENIYSDALTVDNEGNSIIVGRFFGSLDVENYENKGMWDFYLLKYNKDGQKEWIKYWGTENNDSPEDVTVDKNNNIFVSLHSFYDEYIKKYNKDGDLLWSKMWTDNRNVFVKSIKVDSSGNLFVLGNCESKIDGLNSDPDDDHNIFISKWYLDTE